MKNKKSSEAVMPSVGDKRIFCVLANTVQAPLEEVSVKNPMTGKTCIKLVSTPETITIQQPAGRLMAQQGHVVSKARDFMLKKFITKNWAHLKKDSLLFEVYCDPACTINLACRDSAELHHLFQLLDQAGIPAYEFKDFNQPAYGSPDYHVRTAICTEPVNPEDVVGILDHLALWKCNTWDSRW